MPNIVYAFTNLSLPGDPLDRQPPDVTPQPVQPPGRQGYGGVRLRRDTQLPPLPGI